MLIVSLMICTFVNILCFYMDSFTLYNKFTFVGRLCLAFSLATSIIPQFFHNLNVTPFSLDNLKRDLNSYHSNRLVFSVPLFTGQTLNVKNA